MPRHRHLGRALAQSALPAFRRLAAQPARHGDDVRLRFGDRLPAFDLHAGISLPVTGAAVLRHDHRLLELRHGAEHLADEARRWCVVEKRGRAVGRYEVDAAGLQHGEADLLHHEVAGKAARRLDHDDANPAGLDPLQRSLEARPAIDGVGPRTAASLNGSLSSPTLAALDVLR